VGGDELAILLIPHLLALPLTLLPTGVDRRLLAGPQNPVLLNVELMDQACRGDGCTLVAHRVVILVLKVSPILLEARRLQFLIHTVNHVLLGWVDLELT